MRIELPAHYRCWADAAPPSRRLGWNRVLRVTDAFDVAACSPVASAPQSKATKIHNLSEPRFRFATELERAGNLNERGLP